MRIKEAKLHLIQPMAGGGTRFKNDGIIMPKPLIDLFGYHFFHYSMNSIINNVEIEDITFAVLKEHIDKFDIDKKIKEEICKFDLKCNIQVISEILNGAVLTCLEACKMINDDKPILFNDCDHAFVCKDFYDFCNNNKFDSCDGGLLTFESDKPCYSFAELDSNGNVKRTIEKQPVSSHAICGAYYFKNKKIFIKYANIYLKNCEYKEYFMSGVYNAMCSDGLKVVTFNVDKHVSFGTPEEYKNVTIDDLKELK